MVNGSNNAKLITVMTLRSDHLDRILGRLDDMDSLNLSILVKRLARERRLLETVFNTVREGILLVDSTGQVEYSNEAAHAILGFPEEDVGRIVIWKFIPDLARWLDFKGENQELKVVSREIEIHYPEHKHVRLYCVPMEESGGEALQQRWVMILSDITEQTVTTQERIESERLSSIFMLAAGVAHEVGNPLNSINIHLQLMRRQLNKMPKSFELENLQSSVDVCASEVQRLDGIISYFLEALRPQPPDFKDVRLLAVLTEVVTFLKQELTDLGIQVDVEVKDTLPLIEADYGQIKQVFFNLLKNSMEAMDRGGRIKVSAQCDEAFIYISIADTGKGIAQEELPRIFDPFHTTKKEGHGLGMYLIQRILRDHGGQIGIDSRPGVGTVVTLQIPQKNRRMKMLEDTNNT